MGVEEPIILQKVPDGLGPTVEIRQPADRAIGCEDDIVLPRVDLHQLHDVARQEPHIFHSQILRQLSGVVDVIRGEIDSRNGCAHASENDGVRPCVALQMEKGLARNVPQFPQDNGVELVSVLDELGFVVVEMPLSQQIPGLFVLLHLVHCSRPPSLEYTFSIPFRCSHTCRSSAAG